MNETEVAQIVGELRRKHPGPTGACDLSDFELTLALLPEPGVWRVADLTPSVFGLGPGDTLSTVTLGHSPEPGLPCAATLSSRTLDGEKLIARLEWGEYVTVGGGELWRRTHWTFRLQGQNDGQLEEWQDVTGTVRADAGHTGLDYDERYARELLGRLGRRAALGGVIVPAEHEPPGQAPPEPDGSTHQPVTDLWGNPLDKRRRRRR